MNQQQIIDRLHDLVTESRKAAEAARKPFEAEMLRLCDECGKLGHIFHRPFGNMDNRECAICRFPEPGNDAESRTGVGLGGPLGSLHLTR